MSGQACTCAHVMRVGDSEIPPGGGGCTLSDDGRPLKGVLMRDAALNLFGSITVKIAGAPGEHITRFWGGGVC
jgi:hypothetical protein